MVNTLQFNMSVPTPCMFMKRFLKAALSDKKVNTGQSVIFFLIELDVIGGEIIDVL